MDLRQEIENVIRQVADDGGKSLIDDFDDRTVLLESGLDSLDFAIIVARLEQQLDADPFSAMSTPVYPRTLAEFVAVYDGHLDGNQ